MYFIEFHIKYRSCMQSFMIIGQGGPEIQVGQKLGLPCLARILGTY